MADMPGDFWSGYIVGITVISFLCLAWLIYDVYFTGGSEHEASDIVWDDSLREGSNPAPLWWFWLILALMVFSVVYLMLYPGLGSFSGMLRWSQGGEVSESSVLFAAEFGVERERIAGLSSEELVSDEVARRAGQHVFRVHCSACHGMDGAGQANLFPNLRDAAWQWGGSAEQIEQTIAGGRTGIMPPWFAALQEDGTEEVTRFVIALSQGNGDDPEFAAGKARYDQLCFACHGSDGSGNSLLGAPALNDETWTYGGSYEAVRASIADGRTGIMPGFGERLDDTQIKALTAWLAATP